MKFSSGVILLLIPICSCQIDGTKWVWSDNRGRNEGTRIVTSEKRYNGELASFSKPLFQANFNYDGDSQLSNNRYRYEVTETSHSSNYNTYRPRPTQQNRPDISTNIPSAIYRPSVDNNKQINSFNNYRPSNRPFENEYRPLGNGYRPPDQEYYQHGLKPGIGTNGRPILTGPTPSWVENNQQKYKDYDICKCVHSFNCNSPGIKFGVCDSDKQYCCYKSKPTEDSGNSGRPITNLYEKIQPRPVLAGPGGPVDHLNRVHPDKISSGRPFRPDVEKYTDSEREFNDAYKKGLASAIYDLYQRPNAYYDRDPQGYREYYQSDRDYYRPIDNFKSSHPSKYGLYDPSASIYARSSNTTITAINDSKN